jgi:prephenate dehydrogenase
MTATHLNGPIGIIGLGMIGCSLGAALRRAGLTVFGFDIDPKHVGIAMERGYVDDAKPTLDQAVKGCEAVVLAVPVAVILQLLPRAESACPPEALLMDTGSVKLPVVEAMANLRTARRAIGGHPIAGKETCGPDSADWNLFRAKTFALTPSVETDPETKDRARELATIVGAVPTFCDAREHDRALAVTSHLPQMLSTCLSLAAKGTAPDFAGAAFQDMVRLSVSDPEMWLSIFVANRENVIDAGHTFSAFLSNFIQAVENSDRDEIIRLMLQGRPESDSMAQEPVESAR